MSPFLSPHLCRRTFKYLQGVLGAKWVLEEGWLAACLEQGGPAEEAAFQVTVGHTGA